jgi:DNA-binding MarR family transcriptional regulator
VTRKPNPTDRRERAIAVTPSGTKRLTAIRTQLERATQHVLSPLSAKQRDTFLDALHTVVACLALPENQPSADEYR